MYPPQLDRGSVTIEDLLALVQDLQTQIAELRDENAALREENIALRVENLQLREEFARRGGPPSWAKANSPLQQKKTKQKAQQQKERKKREQSSARKRETPTEIVSHALSHCPDCGRALTGGWTHRSRQIIEIPMMAARIIEHLLVARHCGVCDKRCLPSVDFSDQVVGQHRIGVTLMSLIGTLHQMCRLPIRTIGTLLHTLYGVRISIGEIVAVLDTIAKQGKDHADHLRDQVRASPYAHADETGWRENGHNGYLWSFSTPTIRYLHYDHSRAGAIPREVLGDAFNTIVVSDFYGGYNCLNCGHQRCWVHFLRDLHRLKEEHPKDKDVQQWVKQVIALYRKAIAYQKACRHAQASSPVMHGYNVLQRRDKRRWFEGQAAWLAEPYVEQKGADAPPQTVLAKRLDRFASELFLFVEHPDVPSENNAAERAIRPQVIARKIRGGTKSAKGSQTYTTLSSLFGTWQLQGHNVMQTCQIMLQGKLPLVQPT